MNQNIINNTLCPYCTEELNDDDGTFFDKYADTKKCPNCENTITYVKQFKEDFGNPYCDFVWNKTYIEWEFDV